MALTINDWKVGDYVFFGSRWHKVTGVTRKGEPRHKWTTTLNEEDFLAVKCGTGNYGYWSGHARGTKRAVPTDEQFRIAEADSDTAKPVCQTCSGASYGRGIPTSAISDPVLRARIERRIKNRSQYRWLLYLDAPE